MEILIQTAQHRVFNLSQLGLVCNVGMWVSQQGICVLAKHEVLRVSQKPLPCIMSTSGFNTWAETGPRASRLESTTSINCCVYLVPRACHYVMLTPSTGQLITWLIAGGKSDLIRGFDRFFCSWRFYSFGGAHCTDMWVNGLIKHVLCDFEISANSSL